MQISVTAWSQLEQVIQARDATGVANGAQQVRDYIAAVGAGGFQADGSGGDVG